MQRRSVSLIPISSSWSTLALPLVGGWEKSEWEAGSRRGEERWRDSGWRK